MENGQQVIRLICTNDAGELQGVLPLILTRGVPFGIGGIAGSRRLSSLPRTPFCGPIANSIEISGRLITRSFEIMQKNHVERFQCKSMSSELDTASATLQKVIWRKTCIKYFPDPSTALTFGNHRNHLRISTSVRKTATAGVVIRELTDINDLRTWYRLYIKTMQRHLVPARSYRFFFTLWNNLFSSGNLKIIIAEYGKGASRTMIAGSLFLLFRDGCYYAFNGSDPHYYSMRPNDTIQWYFQNYAHKEGYRYLDLGEVSHGNTGLRAFKCKWGIEEKEIFHYYFPPIDHHPDTTETGLLRKVVPHVWKNIPSSLTAVAGTFINKYL